MARQLVRIHFESPGDRKYDRAFMALAAAVEDLSPVFDRMGGDILAGVQEQFTSQGAARSSPWQPLDGEYADWKQAHYPGAPILVATGKMRHLMLDPAALHVDKHSLRYEPESDIFLYHQKGTTDIPQRKMIVITEADKRRWDRYWAEWLAAMRDTWLH